MKHQTTRKPKRIYAKISNTQKIKIFKYITEGKSLSNISKKMNINYSTIKTIWRTFRLEKRILNKKDHKDYLVYLKKNNNNRVNKICNIKSKENSFNDQKLERFKVYLNSTLNLMLSYSYLIKLQSFALIKEIESLEKIVIFTNFLNQ